jgi:ketosteroid isomerase-like protein
MAIDVQRWLAAYGAAWEAHDGAAAAALFSPDGTYCWGPFEAPLVGGDAIRARWDAVTAEQGRVRFAAEPLGRDGERAFARWTVAIEPQGTGAKVELDGVFVLDFASDGRCRRLQEWWMVKPGGGA